MIYKVSIIVPVYNVEKYLPRCLESLLTQNFWNFEVILVDDGSTDRSGVICDTYAQKDKRIKVIHQKNGGVCKARNAGLDIAAGEYVTFCDSDDYCTTVWLQNLVNAAQNEKAQLVVSGYQAIDETDQILSTFRCEVGTWCTETESKKIDYILDKVLFGDNCWNLYTSLFVNDIIQQNRIRFCTTCGNFAEDMGFTLEYLLYCSKICGIDSQEYRYLQHSGSMMANSKNVVKLDSVNEVSAQFGRRFFADIKDRKVRRLFPMLHFMICRNQCRVYLYGDKGKELIDASKNIQKLQWFDRWMKKVWHNYRTLKYYCGKRLAQEFVLLSYLCYHRNWKRYGIESAIAYKWFIK